MYLIIRYGYERNGVVIYLTWIIYNKNNGSFSQLTYKDNYFAYQNFVPVKSTTNFEASSNSAVFVMLSIVSLLLLIPIMRSWCLTA